MTEPVEDAAHLELQVVGWEAVALALMASEIPHQDEDIVANTAFLEASLVHARCLIEFLVGRRDDAGQWGNYPHPHAIKPTSFVPDWRPPDTPVGARLKGDLKLIDRHMAHLSTDRIRLHRQRWKLGRLCDDVISVLDDFLVRLTHVDAAMAATLAPRMHLARQKRREARAGGAQATQAWTTSDARLILNTGEPPG